MTHSLPFCSMYGVIQVVICGCVVLMVAGCSGPAPVLYPNRHLKSVEEASVKDDISSCRDKAEEAGASQGAGTGGKVATNTAVGAGAGAASGAVGGAISGGVGIGALIGAASGAVFGFVTGLFSAGASHPSQAYVNFVNRCLEEKGYEVSGWQ